MTESTSTARLDGPENCVFQLVVNAETIQTALGVVGALVDECHLYVREDEVRIRAMDPTTVAGVDLTLERSVFEAYDGGNVRDGSDIDDEGDVHVGVDVTKLGTVLKMADRDQLVRLALDAETRRLEIRMGELSYELALLDPETVRAPLDESGPDIGFTGRVVITADEVGRTIRAADMVSTYLALGVDEAEETFYAEAKGDTDDVSLALPGDDLVEFSPGDAHSLYSVDYLRAIDRAMPKDAEIDLRLGTEVPLKLCYEFAEGAGSVEYLLAPRLTANR